MYRSEGKVPFAWENKPGIPKTAAPTPVELYQEECYSGEFIVLQGILTARFPPYLPSARCRPLARHIPIPPPPPSAPHRRHPDYDGDPFAAALEECKRRRSKVSTDPRLPSSASSSTSSSTSSGGRRNELVSSGARWRRWVALSGLSCKNSDVLDVYD